MELEILISVDKKLFWLQLVDRLDEGAIVAEVGPLDYKGLYKAINMMLFFLFSCFKFFCFKKAVYDNYTNLIHT